MGGRLLVATPVIGDPNFDRTVVFVLDHTEDGALGIVVNRPTDVPLSDSLPNWDPLVADPPVVFVGGPVEQSAAIGLGRPGPGSAPAEGDDAPWSPVATVADTVGPLATVDLTAGHLAALGLEALRVYVGYAGWGPGQLDGELDQEAWVVADALPGDLWSRTPEGLWGDVLRRQRGETAWLALYPRDPSGN